MTWAREGFLRGALSCSEAMVYTACSPPTESLVSTGLISGCTLRNINLRKSNKVIMTSTLTYNSVIED